MPINYILFHVLLQFCIMNANRLFYIKVSFCGMIVTEFFLPGPGNKWMMLNAAASFASVFESNSYFCIYWFPLCLK
jgi:hypothetical protein